LAICVIFTLCGLLESHESVYILCHIVIVAIILRILFIAPIPKFIYRSLTKPATIGFGATLSGAQVI